MGGEEVPAVGGDLQGGLQSGQAGMLGPGGRGGWMHAQRTGLLAFATRIIRACVAGLTSGSRTSEPWLSLEELVEGSLCDSEFQPSAWAQSKWFSKTSGAGSVVPGTIEEKVSIARVVGLCFGGSVWPEMILLQKQLRHSKPELRTGARIQTAASQHRHLRTTRK